MDRFPRMYYNIIEIKIESPPWFEQYLRQISIENLLVENRCLNRVNVVKKIHIILLLQEILIKKKSNKFITIH